MLKGKFKQLEARLLSEIKYVYGERLVSVAIYGSAARGTQRFDSDIDLLMIVKDLPKGRMKRIREFDAVEKRIEPFMKTLEKYDINTYISVVIKTPEEVEQGSPLFLDMVEDAKILFDRNGFFNSVLTNLKNKLKELNSKRVWKGNAWYWILKPDYKPGDVIEI